MRLLQRLSYRIYVVRFISVILQAGIHLALLKLLPLLPRQHCSALPDQIGADDNCALIRAVK